MKRRCPDLKTCKTEAGVALCKFILVEQDLFSCALIRLIVSC